MGTTMNRKRINATLDSGAGCSVIDIGTVQEIGLEQNIVPSSHHLVNASGERMDIAGVVNIKIRLQGMKPMVHEFKVLNAKTFSNVLLGRDFMKLFGQVTFDFNANKVRLGRSWIKGVKLQSREKVRLVTDTIVPARSEQVVSVQSKDY